MLTKDEPHSDALAMKSTTLQMADMMGEYRSSSKGCQDRMALQPSNWHCNEGEQDGDDVFLIHIHYFVISDDDWEKMQGHHTQWLGEEKQMLADQYKQQEVLWQKHSQRLTEIVRNNEGVWLSAKLFYIVGSLSLLSIITIVLEIAFYVYFHWIQ